MGVGKIQASWWQTFYKTCYNLGISMKIQQIHFSLVKWQEWFKQCNTKLSQNISTWNYILFTVSYQNILLQPENPTQGHVTSCHKDVKYAMKTSIMPRRHQLCHKDIICATKTSIMP